MGERPRVILKDYLRGVRSGILKHSLRIVRDRRRQAHPRQFAYACGIPLGQRDKGLARM